MPLISVIIPTHNRGEYLSEAIDSVLNQSHQDFEIIIIDDGSTDNTKSIVINYIKKYQDKIHYLYQKASGPSSARNNGIRNAIGEYIAFLDSDDKWLPHKLARQLKVAQEFNTGFNYCDAYVEDKGMMTKRIKPTSPALNFYDLFIGEKHIVTSTVFIKKEYLENAELFDEALQVAEDRDLWLRLLLHYRVEHINEPLVVYREHGSNISNDNELMLKCGIRICKKFLKIDKIPKKISKSQLARQYYMLGKLYYENSKYKEAAREMRNAIVTYPCVGLNFSPHPITFINQIFFIIKPYLVFLFLIVRSNL